MESIIGKVTDPDWWFDAIVVAIIVAVVAGFIKDKCSKLLAAISIRYRNWQSREIAARTALVNSIASDKELLILGYLRTIHLTLLWSMGLLMYFSSPSFFGSTPGIASFDTIARIATHLLGVLSIVVGYRAASRASLVATAFQKYRKIQGWPRF